MNPSKGNMPIVRKNMLQEVGGAKHINSQKLISKHPNTKLVAKAKTMGYVIWVLKCQMGRVKATA
jgi:hypothetical protein